MFLNFFVLFLVACSVFAWCLEQFVYVLYGVPMSADVLGLFVLYVVNMFVGQFVDR